MRILNDEERNRVAMMMIEQRSFAEIRRYLKVGKNHDLKSTCEYNGTVLEKAYSLHKNSIKTEILPSILPEDQLVTKGDLFKMLEAFKSTTEDTTIKKIENTTSDTTKGSENDYIEINEIPNMLPNRLVGENYVVKTTSVKVVDNVWKEFKDLSSSSTHSSIELLSLALLEFADKYRSK